MGKTEQLFIKAFGRADPEAANGLQFDNPSDRNMWESDRRLIKPGWYRNRFLYLFGAGLERLEGCLAAWSFVVPPARGRRMIIGRNAYGMILTLEDAEGEDQQVCMLDPLRVIYVNYPGVLFGNLIGAWLPEGLLPEFLDSTLYDAWIKVMGHQLPDDVILAPKKPEGLSGKLKPKDFQEEEIVSYYQTTGPIYAKALADLDAAKPRGSDQPSGPSTKRKK